MVPAAQHVRAVMRVYVRCARHSETLIYVRTYVLRVSLHSFFFFHSHTCLHADHVTKSMFVIKYLRLHVFDVHEAISMCPQASPHVEYENLFEGHYVRGLLEIVGMVFLVHRSCVQAGGQLCFSIVGQPTDFGHAENQWEYEGV